MDSSEFSRVKLDRGQHRTESSPLGLGSAIKHTPTILFFCAVMVSNWFGGLWPGILVGILSDWSRYAGV